MSMPPLTSNVAPVVNPASSESRKATSAATSSGLQTTGPPVAGQ
jgi:hypothetical protein